MHWNESYVTVGGLGVVLYVVFFCGSLWRTILAFQGHQVVPPLMYLPWNAPSNT
jgi:hypothetical protein